MTSLKILLNLSTKQLHKDILRLKQISTFQPAEQRFR